MQGVKEQPELRGIIPSAFHHIFSRIEGAANRKFLVSVSYLEIYNEEIRDLLSREKGGKRGLELKEHPDRGVYVKDLSTYVVKSVDEMDQLMNLGNGNRSVGSTLMNEQSSRSHSIFSISIESMDTSLGGATGADGADDSSKIVAGKLNLVDLAGSERQSKTGASGDRLKEAAKINLSLTALGNCISALVDGKSTHIPYRDSKLTRLLQDSLGGNAKTLMIATASPADYNFDETMSTLRYANRAKNIKNKPRINEDPKDTMLREYQEEIQRLRALLEKRSGAAGGGGGTASAAVKSGKVSKKEKKKSGSNGKISSGSAASIGTAEEGGDLEEMELPESSTTTAGNLEAFEKAEQERVALVHAEIEAERQRLLASTTMASEEREKLVSELNAREAEIDRERLEREELARRLSNMEGKLLVGGVSIHEHVETQHMEIEQRQRKLLDQQEKEHVLKKQLEAKQGAQMQLEETYASLQEEVDVKSKKLKKLWAKLQAVRSEISDMKDDFWKEREELLETIRDLAKEIRLKDEVMDRFLPVKDRQKIEERLHYDQQEEAWTLRSVTDHHREHPLPRPLATPQLFNRPVSLLARHKMASLDLDTRYRPKNILTVKMDAPEQTISKL